MCPIIHRSEAKESGFAQVREALQSFVGDVISAEFGMWGGTLVDDTGKPIPPKEFLEISCVNVEILEISEELAFTPDEWNFRVNCSDYKGSFWVEDFLASADKVKLLIPDDLVGKRIAWKKAIREYEIKGVKVAAINFIIDKVVGAATVTAPAPRLIPAYRPSEVAPGVEEPVNVPVETEDPMEIALGLAVGKTETQFRSAISLHPKFVSSPLLPLAKAGAITKSLVEQGKLVEVQEGNKTIYQKPE